MYCEQQTMFLFLLLHIQQVGCPLVETWNPYMNKCLEFKNQYLLN